MKIIEHNAKVFGQECKMELMHFDKSDRTKWKKLFDIWKNLKSALLTYKSRGPNMPEGLSETAFCLWSGSAKYIKLKGQKKGIAGSFDTFDWKKNRAQQIKACSIKNDLTSFGPKSKWDDLYFIDFYNEGKVDGRFDVYLIPNKYIKNQLLNKKELFADQQNQKRRPRFGIKKEIIAKYKIKPLGKSVKVW
jgi:hypothetical protein